MKANTEIVASTIVVSILGLGANGLFPAVPAAFLGLMLLISLLLRRIPSR